MDCRQPYAMASLVALKDGFDLAVWQRPGRRPPRHRRPAVRADEPQPLPGGGDPLPVHPPAGWREAAVGKTLVSQHPDRPRGRQLGRRLAEVPVGFKWFVDGLLDGSLASAARRAPGPASCAATARVWTTDKDGIILELLAAEITAAHGQGSRRQHYSELTASTATPLVHAHGCAGHARPKRRAAEAVARGRASAARWPASRSSPTLTRAPGNDADHRRPEGGHGERLVRGPALGHREHLQDLRGELHQSVSSECYRG